MRIARTIPAMRRSVGQWRADGERIALVPTMGALHSGHFALVRAGQKRAPRVIASVFVNPTQFSPDEDLAKYPRNLPADLAALRRMAVDLVWAPAPTTMYPPDFSTRIVPAGPAGAGLEDRFRPHFFAGVATVVAKLIIQCSPDFAMFGEKDFQQLKVVSRMVKDLDLPTRIVAVPTVREKDGLALSSRNAYLGPHERAVAPRLYQVLTACATRIAAGEAIARVLKNGVAELERAGFRVDYLEAREADTLQPVRPGTRAKLRLLAAARLGTTRLIDNVPV